MGVIYKFGAATACSPKGSTGLKSDSHYICDWMELYYRGTRASENLGFSLICAKFKPNLYNITLHRTDKYHLANACIRFPISPELGKGLVLCPFIRCPPSPPC